VDIGLSGALGARNYADLLEFVSGSDLPWQETEMGQILAHQLTIPLGDMSSSNPMDSRATFGSAIHDDRPPLELLRSIKAFAKQSRSEVESPLPAAVATALYFISIAAAEVRCGQRITELSPEQIRTGLEWVARIEWVPASFRQLAEHAIEQLAPPSATVTAAGDRTSVQRAHLP